MRFISPVSVFKRSNTQKFAHINAQKPERILCPEVNVRLTYLVRGRFLNCGGRVSLSLFAKRGLVNLDVVSVPSTSPATQ